MASVSISTIENHDTPTNSIGAGHSREQRSSPSSRPEEARGGLPSSEHLGPEGKARRGEGIHLDDQRGGLTARAGADNAKQALSTPQIDNIYSGEYTIIIAAVSLDWQSVVVFDGMAWTLDLEQAKTYPTVAAACEGLGSSHRTTLESPTPHAPEIWRLREDRVDLVAGEGTLKFRSRPASFKR